ncbi:hypothetical protein HDU67_004401, partial [Dinochytrium kinnereticum]
MSNFMAMVGSIALILCSLFALPVFGGTGGTIKMLAFPIIEGNLTLDTQSYSTAVESLKRDFDIDLVIDFLPTKQVTEYAGLLSAMVKVNSSEYDIYQIDVIWPGEFGGHFLDLAPYIPESLKAIHNQEIYNANNIQGKQ